MKASDFLDFDRDAYLAETDRELGLTPGFSAAQIGVESNFNPTAVSPRGAMGLAQVMPNTLAAISKRIGRPLNPFDERDALTVHREVMRENMGRFKNEDDAARAYNGGWTPANWSNPETAGYVPKIRASMGGQPAKATRASASASAAAFLDADEPAPQGASAADFLDGDEPAAQPKETRGLGRKAVDLGLGLGGAVIDAIGAIPTAAGGALKSAGDLTFGASREEVAQRMQEAGTPEKTEEVYQRLNRYEPLNVLGRAADAMGRDIKEVAGKVRGLRSPEAVDAASRSQMTGDIMQPSTWSFGTDPSVEGVVQNATDVAGSMAPVVATAVATRGRSIGTQVKAGMATGTAAGVGQAIDQARDTLHQMSDEQLTKESPVYRELLAAGYSPADARTWLTESAERHAAALTAPVSAVGGAATAALLGKLGGHALERVAKTAVARTLTGAAVGGLEEGIQEVGEGVATNAGVNSATGMNRDVMEGSFANFVGGAMGGTAVGGIKGAVTRSTPQGAAVRAEEFLDAEAAPSAPLALPAPVVRVDGEGNARMDGAPPPMLDEPAARAAGRTDTSMAEELAVLSARPEEVVPAEPAALPAPEVATDARGEQAPVARANAAPISVAADGNARLQGDERTPEQAQDQRIAEQAAQLFPKDEARRADWIDAQRQREMGYEARVRELAEKANAKRKARTQAQAAEAASPGASRSTRDLNPTSELGVVSRQNQDGSTSYFFATNPGDQVTVGAAGEGGVRPLGSITENAQAQSALLRAALADGPVAAGPKTLARDALRGVPGVAVDRSGVTRIVGRAQDKARIAAEVSRVAAKAALERAGKTLDGADLELAQAAIAADPRRAQAVLRSSDRTRVVEGLAEIAPAFRSETADVEVPAAVTQRQREDRMRASGVGVDQDFVSYVTEAGRDAVKAGHMTREEFFAATRAARAGNREAAIAELRKSDTRRGTESQASSGAKAAVDIDPEAKVSLDDVAVDEVKMGPPDFMNDPMERRYVPLWDSAKQAVSQALADIEQMGVPREWMGNIQGYFATLGKDHGVMAFFSKASGKPVRGIGLTEDSIPTSGASLEDQRLFRGRLIHELAHNADHDGTAPRSASEPRLAVAEDGSTGEVAQEIIDIYGNGDGDLAVLFKYPLQGWFDGAYSPATTSSEMHAQIIRAYFTNRAELKRRAPKAYEYATQIVEEPRTGSAGRAGADAPVSGALREQPTGRPGFDVAQPVDRPRARSAEDGRDSASAPRADGLRDQREGGLSDGRLQSERGGNRGERDAGRGAAPQADDGSVRGSSPLPGYAHGQIVGAAGPDARLVSVAEQYARDHGIDLRRQSRYAEVDADRAQRLADAYAAMEHAPQDPKVREAYENLIRQTTDQYRALERAGYKFWLMDPESDPYQGNPWNAMRDLRANQRMAVFPTDAAFGSGATDINVADNPLLADTGIRWPYGSPDGESRPVLANDLFRAVHDALGHGVEGAGFRAQGEENAWQAHARLFTGSALAALTSETRGQNSWLNFGPHAQANQSAKVEDTVFADQKTGLMPEWTWTEGFDAGLESADAQPAVRRSAGPAASMDGAPRRAQGADRPASSPAADAADASVARFADALARDAGRPVPVRAVEAPRGSARAAFAEAVEQRFGTKVVYFASDDDIAPAGAYVPGDPNTVYVTSDTRASAQYIVGHEMTHALKEAHPDLWDGLVRALRSTAEDVYANREEQERSYGRKVPDSLVEEENLSDVAGAAFKQPGFWTAVQEELDAPAMKRLFRWIGRWFNRVFGAKVNLSVDGGFARAAEAMRGDLARAYAEVARRQPAVRSIAADADLSVRKLAPALRTDRTDVADAPKMGAAARAGVAATKTTAPVAAALQTANSLVDKIGAEVARVTGVAKAGRTVVDRAERFLTTRSSWGWLERAKQGLVSDYGLPEQYLEAKTRRQVAENRRLREAKTVLDRLGELSPDQLQVAYQWLQEKPDTARERTLLAQLTPAQQTVMRQMKADIDQLSRDAVAAGLITEETYERNKMAYVHRSYKKYEAELSGSQAVARLRSQRLKGDQFKGRGMELEAGLDRVNGTLPDDLKGMKLEMLELRNGDGKLLRREYLVQGQARPAKLEGYTSAGTWEVRDATKGGKLKVWRDFTLAERQRMGEIEDARYGFARTMLQGVRDVETARFLGWAASQYAKDDAEGLNVVEVKPMAAMLGSQTFTPDDWVKVPETKIKGTSVQRYGALAGKYVPGIMYSDLVGVMEPPSGMWDKMLTAWKLSKTALSPAVHVNNVMANFIMADLADVGANDLRRALETLIAAKGGDAKAKAMVERYEDSGAEGGSFAANEIKTAVLEPLLKQIAEGEPEMVKKASLAQVVSLAAHGHLKEAAYAATKTVAGRATGATVDALLKAYQSEDSVFRFAKFVNEVNAGKTDLQAGKAARDAFLDYDINAPWVRAARRSVLPFISFTYRILPKMAKAVATQPWKFAKYWAAGEALSMLAYAMLGAGGDEDKEKRLLPDELAGKSLWLPKVLRMPWNDRDGDPMWLDVRRWLPAGDLTETNPKSAVPLPQWLSVGGPLSLLIDLASNTDWRGEKLVEKTDTPWQATLKVSDAIAKFALPNLPTPGLGWLLRQVGAPVDSGQLDPYGWNRLEKALKGGKTASGKELDAGTEAARAMGVKLQSRPLADELRAIELDAQASKKEIVTHAKRVGRLMQRGEIDEAEGKRRIERELDKLRALGKKVREKTSPDSSPSE